MFCPWPSVRTSQLCVPALLPLLTNSLCHCGGLSDGQFFVQLQFYKTVFTKSRLACFGKTVPTTKGKWPIGTNSKSRSLTGFQFPPFFLKFSQDKLPLFSAVHCRILIYFDFFKNIKVLD